MSLVEVIVALVILSIAALGVASTINLVSKGRTSVGSPDLKAVSYAREVFEKLKNSVSENTAASTPGALLLDTSYAAGSCSTGVGQFCNATGTRYPSSGTTPLAEGFAYYYWVWDISDGNGGVAYKKVTVSLSWPG